MYSATKLFFIVCSFLFSSSIAFAQYKNIDSLKTQLNSKTGKDRAECLVQLALSTYKKEPAQALKYLEEAEPLAKQFNAVKTTAQALQIKGRIEFNKKEYDNALTKFGESKERAISINNVKLVCDAQWLMGAVYQEMGNVEAIDKLFAGLQPYKTTKEGQEAMARLHKSKAFIYYSRANFDLSKNEFMQARELYKKLDDQSNFIGVSMNVGVLEFKTGETKQSLTTYENALPEAKKLKDTLLIADILTNIALSSLSLGDVEKSVELQKEANALYLKIKNTNKYQSGLTSLAAGLVNKGKYDEAAKYLLSALENSKKNNEHRLAFVCYSQLADLNTTTGDTLRAQKYLMEGLDQALKHNLKREEGVYYRSLGAIESAAGNPSKAQEYLLKAETIFESLKLTKDLEALYLGIGNMYIRTKDYVKAEEYYLKALDMSEKMGSKSSVAGIYSNLGVLNYDQGNYDKSIDYYNKALVLRKEMNIPTQIADSYLTLSNSYYSKKDYEQSYVFYKKYHMLLDSVSRISSKKEMAELQTRFETKEKEQQIVLLSSDQKMKTLLLAQNAKELFNQQLINKDKFREIELLNKDKIINETSLKASQMAQVQQEKELEMANKVRIINEKEAQYEKKMRYAFTIGFVVVFVLAVFILRGYVQKRKDNGVITAQKNEVEQQHRLIQHQKKEITDSINYARRIQQAILPEDMDVAIQDSFLLFKPKDIVSGDFYFYKKTEDGYLLVVADCTGHGVPGAFMSLIGSKELSVITEQTTEPGKILGLLNKALKKTLKQNSETATRDGMDVIIVHVDGRTISYAGANRPLWYVDAQSMELKEVKGTKNAVGGLTAPDQEFEEHELQLQAGDIFYLSSDGFADQFGGDKGKKFTSKKMKEELLKISSKSTKQQEEHLDKMIDTWRGNLEQVDDICVIGIRV